MNVSKELILCIVNAGFTDIVMNVARREGAMGGTIIHARGTAIEDAENKFGIQVNPEKDLVLLVVDAKLKDAIMKAIYSEAGIESKAGSIAFSLPVTDSIGIK